MSEHVDLVIVGGGPGGASAAEAALREKPDLQVVVLEKRARPHGTCAGGVGVPWLDDMSLRLPFSLIESKSTRVRLHGPTNVAEITAKQLNMDALGYVVDRWGFDEWLLSRAVALGACVLRETEFKDIRRENGQWRIEAQTKSGDSISFLTPNVVDASGPMAVVAKRLGMKFNEKPQDMHVGLQWTVPVDSQVVTPETLDLWFKRDPTENAPWAVKTGYVWSFPTAHPYWDGQNQSKKGSYTRIGVGVDLEMNKTPGRTAKECLQQFISAHPEFGSESISENGGLIPTGTPMETARDGIYVVGDAGRFCDPVHGGGIWMGRVSGEEAGRAIATGGGKIQFEREWDRRVGFALRSHYLLKTLIYDLSNVEMDTMIDVLSRFEIQSANPIREIPRAAALLMKHPAFSSKMAFKALRALTA